MIRVLSNLVIPKGEVASTKVAVRVFPVIREDRSETFWSPNLFSSVLFSPDFQRTDYRGFYGKH